MTDEPNDQIEPESAVPELAAAPKAKKPRVTKPKTAKAKTATPKATAPKVRKVKPVKAEDPVGDVSDGEAATAAEPVAAAEPEAQSEPEAAVEAAPQAVTEAEIEAAEDPAETNTEAESDEDEPEFTPQPRPPAKLERLQKILAQAGVASRRKAEEMIEQGRVQVNGKIVTELGTKADAGRDHIRVDGKLLQGAERLRYFILNKPKGFVTTVKDPEGRPTVMQFFEKMRERLYPVGRLDYMSEGLLLVTNDGELANKLTKASSGVEKTYLVKVAGQPTEAELDILRGGVAIERGKPGSARVRTSPARIRQVRQGDNPWYEVILIEGRNRELRKMFEEVGHFVEKIRRVGYGPLVLDQEPGNLRELQPEELAALRQVAEGKARTPKSKEVRRRNALDAAGLPTVAPRPTIHPRPAKPFVAKPFEERSAATDRPGEFRPKKSFGTDRPARSTGRDFRPAAGRTPDRGPARPDDRFRRDAGTGPAKFGSPRPTGRPAARPAWKKDDRPARPASFTPESTSPERSGTDRPRSTSAGSGRTSSGGNFGAKPAWNKSAGRTDRPTFKRPAGPRREAPDNDDDLGPVRPPNLLIEEIQPSERSSSTSRPSSSRPSAPRPYADRSGPGRSSAPRPYTDRPSRPYSDRSSSDRPRPTRPASDRPGPGSRPSFRSEGGLPRAFTTSSGKPRAGGARPSSKPGKPAGRTYGAGPGAGAGARSGSAP
ncbi:MAG: pseudouridine synthase, partial [Terracidiphilus sp.]|nr:pseudouridine synthase [Terracidiphilus sp.]